MTWFHMLSENTSEENHDIALQFEIHSDNLKSSEIGVLFCGANSPSNANSQTLSVFVPKSENTILSNPVWEMPSEYYRTVLLAC